MKAELYEMERLLEQKYWQAWDSTLRTLKCVTNTNDLGLKGCCFLCVCLFFAYKTKGFMNSGTVVLSFFQYFLHFYFGNRVFNLRRPMLFALRFLPR